MTTGERGRSSRGRAGPVQVRGVRVRAVRVASAVLAVLATATVLAGCGLPGGGSPSPSSTEPPVTPRSGPEETRTAVPYATAAPQQTLDLYLPAGDGVTVRALVVLIHGGGFQGGDSAGETTRARFLVSQGFAAASLNYRLSGDAPFPAGVQDVKAAIRYLRVNAPAWGVDPGRIGVFGESAGGYLASMIGATADDPAFDDASLGNPGVSSAVRAVASWYGPVDFATMDEQAAAAGCDEADRVHSLEGSPEARWLGAPLADVPDLVARADVTGHVRRAKALPPFRLVHGDHDCTVAPGQSSELRDALDERDAEVTLVHVHDAGHADPRIDEEQLGPTADFFRSALRGRSG